MNQLWGIVLIVFSLIGWLGQVISLISPRVAARLGVSEPEADVDPVYWADIRGGGMWLYFAGRAILTRVTMQRRGIRIGMPKTLLVNYIFITAWGLIAVVTIFLAVAAMPILK